MTTVIHHGPPGSYKTFSLVQRVLIPALKAGRVVITNIRGFNDLEAVRTAYKCDLPDTAAIMYLEPDPEGYDLIAKFFHWAPAGALIAMDEGQRVYPTRLKSFDCHDQADNIVITDTAGNPLINTETQQPICRPSNVEIAFDQHRHFNWDIYISTPNIGKIHGEIRKVTEWAYRHRNNSGLLPWLKNSWTEFRHDSEQTGKQISHYSGSPKRYKADPRAFDCYQSTATGKTKGSTENISIFRDPKLRLMFVIIVACLSYVCYSMSSAYSRFNANLQGSAKPVADVVPENVPAAVRSSDHVRSGDAGDRFSLQTRLANSTNLMSFFTENQVYYTGDMDRFNFFFEVHTPDGDIHHFRSDDMTGLGFRIVRRSNAFVQLDWQGVIIYAWTKPRSDSQIATADTDRATMEREAVVAGANPFM
jgi:zona occludens toxin